jgi:TetR/AcrR family transcriptional repressor of nem operon
MRYAPDQKAETRTRLVREAAARMRALGPDGIGVADLMRGIGLTHGGFYAHFRSKDDLIAQAVGQMFTESRARFDRVPEQREGADRLALFVTRYLSGEHRDRPDRGCPLTSITADITRQGEDARAAFDAGVAALTGRIDAMLPQSDPALAASLINEMAGAVALSRAVSDRAASDQILAATRDAIRRRAGLPDETCPEPCKETP